MVTVALLVVAGVGVGVVSALFGVGGGIVIVPLLVLAFGEAQHVSEGTSLAVAMPAAISGALAHRKRGYISFHHSRHLALGGVAGAVVGAFSALSLPGGALQATFGVVLLLVGVRTIRGGRARMRAEREAEGEARSERETAGTSTAGEAMLALPAPAHHGQHVHAASTARRS